MFALRGRPQEDERNLKINAMCICFWFPYIVFLWVSFSSILCKWSLHIFVRRSRIQLWRTILDQSLIIFVNLAHLWVSLSFRRPGTFEAVKGQIRGRVHAVYHCWACGCWRGLSKRRLKKHKFTTIETGEHPSLRGNWICSSCQGLFCLSLL